MTLNGGRADVEGLGDLAHGETLSAKLAETIHVEMGAWSSETGTPSFGSGHTGFDPLDQESPLELGHCRSAYVFDGIDHPLRMAQVSYACSKDAATACVLSNGSYTCPEANPPSQTCVPSATHAYFYEVDLAGNVRRLRDSSGGMDLGGYRYTAFGNAFAADATTPAPSIDQPLRWKGRPFVNVAGGLYDIRARWWSPQLGAFLTVDGYQYQDSNSTLW